MTKFGQEKKPFDVLKDIAEKHKVLRKQARLTQGELAKRSGVSLGSLKRFELSGQISLESMLKLAQVINRIGDFELVFNENDDLKNIDKLFSDRTRN
jgi:transcriptional regulator with XRE-family HTH domain